MQNKWRAIEETEENGETPKMQDNCDGIMEDQKPKEAVRRTATKQCRFTLRNVYY